MMDEIKALEISQKLIKRRQDIVSLIGIDSYKSKIDMFKQSVKYEMQSKGLSVFNAVNSLIIREYKDTSELLKSMVICAGLEIIEES